MNATGHTTGKTNSPKNNTNLENQSGPGFCGVTNHIAAELIAPKHIASMTESPQFLCLLGTNSSCTLIDINPGTSNARSELGLL
jgi:hypothetical protein